MPSSTLVHCYQLGASGSQTVEGTAADEVLHSPLVHVRAVEHPLAEILEGGKGPVLLPLAHHGLDKAPADVLHGHQAEADAALLHGEPVIGAVHIRRQQGDAAVLALGDVFGHRREQRGQACGPAHDVEAFGRDVRERQTGEGLVEHISQKLRLVLGDLRDCPDHFVLDGARVGHNDDDKSHFVHRDDLELADRDLRERGGDRDRCVIGQRGEQLACLLHQMVELTHLCEYSLLKSRTVVVCCLARLFHQLVDVQPVSGGRRDASGGGVRLLQISERRQLRHLVADGRGGKIHVRHLRNGLGRHRLRRADVKIHDRTQDLLFPV